MNPHNRNRAFVSVEGIKVDVMIDGLSSQNRALDGDTVLIQLLNPSRWPSLKLSNVIVGGKKVEPKGLTNDTAVETRVIDVERGLSHHSEDHQSSSVQAEEEAEEVKPKQHHHIVPTNMLGESEDEDGEDEAPGEEEPIAEEDYSSSGESSEDNEVENFMEKEEEKNAADGDARFADDQRVDSDEESIEEEVDEKKLTNPNPFKRAREPKEHRQPKARQEKQIKVQNSYVFGEGKNRQEVIQLVN